MSLEFKPTPISSYLVKVHSRCNLMCDYCYEYNCGNTSWKQKPREMDDKVYEQLLVRVKEHALEHNITEIFFSFHGGEPLLRSSEFFTYAVNRAKDYLEPATKISFGMQSNGTLLTGELIDLMANLDISYGLSIDGPPHVHNKFRVYSNGDKSYEEAARGARLLQSENGKKVSGGFLAVIDVTEDPIEIFEHLAAFNPPSIDFLEPHATLDQMPRGKKNFKDESYGKWLITLFDYWFDSSANHIPIRKFEELIEHIFGGSGSVESFGLEPVNLLTIATNGDVETVDCVKASAPNAHFLGLNIFDNTIDQVLTHEMIKIRQIGIEALASECRSCELVAICGGGYFPHRFSQKNGYHNPTVYCQDYKILIKHISSRIKTELYAAPSKT